MGLDACKGGWVVVQHEISSNSEVVHRVEVVKELDDLSIKNGPKYIIGIDIPIGLLDRAEKGGRACDREARRVLPYPRSSSVFSPPIRAAIRAKDYETALQINKVSSPDSIGISIQAFNIIPKIRDADLFAQKHLKSKSISIYEVHPELSFFEMAGKKLESKHTNRGRSQRVELLGNQGFEIADLLSNLNDNRKLKEDDLLDATAVAWSCKRIAHGKHKTTQGTSNQFDDRGLPMSIHW